MILMCWVCYPLLTQHSIKRTYHSQIGNHSLPPLQLPNFMLHVFGIFLSLACLFGAIHTFGRGSLALQVAPKEYGGEIASASSLLKSRSRVELIQLIGSFFPLRPVATFESPMVAAHLNVRAGSPLDE